MLLDRDVAERLPESVERAHDAERELGARADRERPDQRGGIERRAGRDAHFERVAGAHRTIALRGCGDEPVDTVVLPALLDTPAATACTLPVPLVNSTS